MSDSINPIAQPRAQRRGLRFAMRAALTVLALVVLCIALSSAFGFTWLRPAVQRYVREHAERQIDFDELRLGFTSAFEPRVEFRGLTVQNAPWASPQPFARAGSVIFAFSWRSVQRGPYIVNKLTLIDADIDLERQADGLRNWRLAHPDDRGPGKVRVLSLDAQRSHVRFVHRGIGLELNTGMTALDSATANVAAVAAIAGRSDLPLTKQLLFSGKRDGKAFEGSAAISDVITFFDTGRVFALRGIVTADKARMNIEGTASDVAQLQNIDADVHVTADSLASFHVLPHAETLPASKPIDLAAHVHRDHQDWSASRVLAKIGRTDLGGEMQLREPKNRDERPSLEAAVESRTFDIDDVRALLKNTSADVVAAARSVASSASNAASSSLASSSASEPKASPKNAAEPSATLRTVPPGSFDTAGLHRIDVDLKLHIDALANAMPTKLDVRNLQTHATLVGGVLNMNPLAVDIAGGHASGNLRVDGSNALADIALVVTVDGLPLDRLPGKLAAEKRVDGALGGHADLRARGDSLRAIAASASGSLNAHLVGGRISSKLDAELALDGGRFMRSLVGGDDMLKVDCATVVVDVKNGSGKGRLSLDSERTSVAAAGNFDLNRETFDVTMTPHRKRAALLALDRSVHVDGTFAGGRMNRTKLSVIDPVGLTDVDHCRVITTAVVKPKV